MLFFTDGRRPAGARRCAPVCDANRSYRGFNLFAAEDPLASKTAPQLTRTIKRLRGHGAGAAVRGVAGVAEGDSACDRSQPREDGLEVRGERALDREGLSGQGV